MCERKSFIDPLYRCGCCGVVSNQTEVQIDLGRCPICGERDLSPAGSGRVTYEAAGFDHEGRPNWWRLAALIPQNVPARP